MLFLSPLKVVPVVDPRNLAGKLQGNEILENATELWQFDDVHWFYLSFITCHIPAPDSGSLPLVLWLFCQLKRQGTADCYSCYSSFGVEIIMSSPAFMKLLFASERLIEWFRLGTAFFARALRHIHLFSYKFVLVACNWLYVFLGQHENTLCWNQTCSCTNVCDWSLDDSSRASATGCGAQILIHEASMQWHWGERFRLVSWALMGTALLVDCQKDMKVFRVSRNLKGSPEAYTCQTKSGGQAWAGTVASESIRKLPVFRIVPSESKGETTSQKWAVTRLWLSFSLACDCLDPSES